MSAVKGRDTRPEMTVGRLVHSMGYRSRLYQKELPGRPDLVFPARHKVIFVHGCFWHQHYCLQGAKLPKSNRDYWVPKLQRNKQRDADNLIRLRYMGWGVLVVWERKIKDLDAIRAQTKAFLEK